MNAGNRSLIDFIETPVLVGDPDGRAVYLNPCFEADFLVASEDAVGRPLANLFEGGGREALLRAVATVCEPEGKSTTRLSLMAGDRGYRVVVSAVEAEGGRVGVILLLTRESTAEARLQAFRRAVLSSLEEIDECLASVASHADGPSVDLQRLAVADGVRCVERIRKWGEEIAASLNEE
jgi:nitrogen-specific signal transduction histidine kinase